MVGSRASRYTCGVALAGLTVGTAVAGQGAAAAASSRSPVASSQRVIVLLRDQATPAQQRGFTFAARATDAAEAQNVVLNRVGGPAPRHVVHLSLANAFAATVTSQQATGLAADPSVASVMPDSAVAMPATPDVTSSGSSARSSNHAAVSPDTDPPTAICPSDPAVPLVEPEALGSIKALTTDGTPYAQQLSTGTGETVAIIANGIDVNSPDFIRPDAEHVFVDYRDFSGSGPTASTSGTQAFGDASSIAAQGNETYDLSQFVNAAHPLPPGCNIKIVGVAPGVKLVGLRAGDGSLTTSAILQSINYAVTVDHVNVIDESFAVDAFHDYASRQVINLFNNRAVHAGVTVTAAAGDGGLNGPLASNAQNPKVISAGATTDNQFAAQTTYAAIQFSNGRWLSNNISALSSGGATPYGRTVDLVAPGETDWAVCSPTVTYSGCRNFKAAASVIQLFGGTGESAALTAGVAALVISGYKASHNGHAPSPAVVKRIVTGTATDLGLPPSEQGSGLLNARAATEAALTWPGAKTTPDPSVKSNVVPSRDQVTLTGKQGHRVSGSVSITNVGTKKLTVATGTRRLATTSSSTSTVAFDSTTLPTFVSSNGDALAYKTTKFTVPSGMARLAVRTTWNGTGSGGNSVVRMTLLSPDGTFASDSQPQSTSVSSNTGTADARHPAAGTWTVVLSSPAGGLGYTGNIQLARDVSRAVPVGSVTPAKFTLAAGKSKKVSFHFALPKSSTGDHDYALTIASSGGHQTAVGVTTRALINTAAGHGKFSGVTSGGDALSAAPAQTFSYGFTVPAGKPGINASLAFAGNPGTPVDLLLIDPRGEVSDLASNESLNASDQVVIGRRIQAFVGAPQAGRWVLMVLVHNPATAGMLHQSFSGVVHLSGLPVQRGRLPDSTSRYIKRHSSLTVRLKVKNPGRLPIVLGVDARTSKYGTRQPVPVAGEGTVDLPPIGPEAPAYLIPPDTKQLAVAASSTTPAEIDIQGPGGGAEAAGSPSSHGSVSTASAAESGAGNYLARGRWQTVIWPIGPFSSSGAPPGHSDITASIVTRHFDPSITTTYGDPALLAFHPSLDLTGKLLTIPAGKSRTLVIHLKPTAKKGRHISGLINLVTMPDAPAGSTGLTMFGTGEVDAVLPFAYTVGTKPKAHHHARPNAHQGG
jgi:hypothetical protein